MLDTLSSPLADVVTASFAVLPSDPGAPDGHSGISAGVWAAASEAVRDERGGKRGIVFIRLTSPTAESRRSGAIGNAVSLSGRGAACQNTGPKLWPTRQSSRPPDAPVPHSFLEYVRSFGPGIVIVLTWLGAGDVVDMGAAGANYGYALIWVFVVAILFRFLFVSLIVRYHLCNQHGEGVLDGLARLHPIYAPVLFFAAIVMGHVYGSYMTRGVGEVCRNVFGFGAIWQWAVACNAAGVLPRVPAELSRARVRLLLFSRRAVGVVPGVGDLGRLRSRRRRARVRPPGDAGQRTAPTIPRTWRWR